MTYMIPAANLEHLQSKIAELAKRQAKIAKKGALADVTPIGITVGEKIVVEVADDYGVMRKRVRFPVTITGDRPMLAGWEFIATIAHEEAGNLLLSLPTAEIGEDLLKPYRTSPSACDHCHTKRQRNDTFIVRQEITGIVKQVGRNCLADFLGNVSPHAIAAMAELLAAAGALAAGGESDNWLMGGGRLAAEMHEYLTWVACAIRTGGWLSRTQAKEQGGTATADVAWDWMTAPTSELGKHPKPTAEDAARASLVLEWADQHLNDADPNSLSDYEHNLRVVTNGSVATARNAGIAASLISYYERTLAKEHEALAAKAAGHFGKPGDKGTWTLTLVGVYDADSMYGTVHIHRFLTLAGQTAIWKTGSIRLDPGTIYEVKGAIKEHGEYKSIPQTILTRCKATKKAA